MDTLYIIINKDIEDFLKNLINGIIKIINIRIKIIIIINIV